MPLAEPRSVGGGTADEAGGGGLGEEGADADQDHAQKHGRQARRRRRGKPERRDAQRAQKAGRVPKRSTARPASGVVKMDGRKTK